MKVPPALMLCEFSNAMAHEMKRSKRKILNSAGLGRRGSGGYQYLPVIGAKSKR
jgi:hypothetical protein